MRAISDFLAAKRDPFSIERFRELHGDLLKNSKLLLQPAVGPSELPPSLHALTEARKSTISILRQMTECLVYADQHDRPQHFELFADRDVMHLMWRLISLDGERPESLPRGQLALHLQLQVQVIQTVSILVTQMRNAQSIFYLLSRNVINDLLVALLLLYVFPPTHSHRFISVSAFLMMYALMRIFVLISSTSFARSLRDSPQNSHRF